ncbi:cupin-like domain-containing protein [Sphingomonas sp. QA11]|uniref:DUF6065 family protein n=1 Tax=Sphingomonas sp. QA11 TaxID=2950605 RepID=UPI00234A9EEF|nr:DUF6065 family protein [Sphingomonas sp. QA11]WCM25890.1 cupin-like domain-containing protein [Sphingomonas sp. QA11]
MDLTCYVFPEWQPRIRAAVMQRDWMDRSPESFAYRCLPLGIANAHGWEILSPCAFEAEWNGGGQPEDVTIRIDEGCTYPTRPVALFGQGTLTFHIEGLIKTPPGWNLWVGGCPNTAKDGIAPLGGVIETDWSPYSFTMNWRFTRALHPIRFEENEPFCFFFPVERRTIEAIRPAFRSIDDAPELKAQFETWSRSRDAFQAAVAASPPAKPADKWQKLYYRGVDPSGFALICDHQTKVRAAEFDAELAASYVSPPPAGQTSDARTVVTPADQLTVALSKRNWLLRTRAELRALSPAASGIHRKTGLSPRSFLDGHYARNHPVVLGDVAAGWPARKRWSAAYLRDRLGDAVVEAQSNRTADRSFERNKDAHRDELTFRQFIERIEVGGNDLYITAYNSGANRDAFTVLATDIGQIDGIIDPESSTATGMMWIGPGGTFTPLHHDLTNNLLVQLVGRKRLVLAAPDEVWRLYNDQHVFSQIDDLRGSIDFAAFPLLEGITLHEIILNPGDAIFLPVGWWHQVEALDFSVSITFTNFVWPNDSYAHYPSAAVAESA